MTRRSYAAQLLMAVTMSALFASISLAQIWAEQSIDTMNLLDDVWLIDAENGWIVGDIGTSFWTDDGGLTWNQVTLTGQDLGGVAFMDPAIGLIVGDNGLIFRTTNSGLNWTQVPSGTDNNLASVSFGDGGKAYAVGRNGTILRSDDSGTSWNVVETGTDRYRSVWARGTLNAWIVGDGGVIRASTDGGLTFPARSSGTGSDLKGVYFLDLAEGWAVGQNSTVIYTNNGGTTWAPRSTGINVGLDSVHFVNSNEGWAVGNLGTIYHTPNGGLTWIQEVSNTSNELNDVFFVDAARGWAVGDLGTVQHRFDPTPVTSPAGGTPRALTLSPAYPNPFNPNTSIKFELPSKTTVSLTVHDLTGRLVRTVVRDELPAGEHTKTWDGRDDRGRELPSGLYLARLATKEGVYTRKLVMNK